MSEVWGAGIVNHGGHEDLARCLDTLAAQSLPPRAVHVYDTGRDPARIAELAALHPRVVFESGPNLGYAGGANRVVASLRAHPSDPSWGLLLNPDVALEPDFAERLLESVASCPRVAIATGKLLRPDRRTLDSAGIVIPRHRRPRDRGSEEIDEGRYDVTERVDAASGAALWLRLDRVDALSLEGELFDECFFVYHEDTDLCWRARRFGFEVLYEPRAVALHARGWQRAGRAAVPVAVRRHSFKNHYLQLAKNETARGLLANLPWLLGWEVLRLGFVVLRERDLLSAYRDAWRALPDALRKRRLVQARASASGFTPPNEVADSGSAGPSAGRPGAA